MDPSELVGTWKLVSMTTQHADGSVDYLFGQDATGYIFYLADGYMSVNLTAGGREPYATSDFMLASERERAAAAATCISYAGPYEIDGDQIVHHIEVSLFPNWIGSEQRRFFHLVGNQLTLSTPPIIVDGKEQRGYLIWERLSKRD